MKNTTSLQKSSDAALGKALSAAANVHASLIGIKSGGGRKVLMSLIRKDIAELNQRVHEYNAYTNALETE